VSISTNHVIDSGLDTMFGDIIAYAQAAGLTFGQAIYGVNSYSSDLGDMFTNWLDGGAPYELDEVV